MQAKPINGFLQVGVPLIPRAELRDAEMVYICFMRHTLQTELNAAAPLLLAQLQARFPEIGLVQLSLQDDVDWMGTPCITGRAVFADEVPNGVIIAHLEAVERFIQAQLPEEDEVRSIFLALAHEYDLAHHQEDEENFFG
jgi:hypothetical protein